MMSHSQFIKEYIDVYCESFEIMNIKPIKTEQDYREALVRLEVIFDAKKDSPEGGELEILGVLIKNYEDEQFPIGIPDPFEAMIFRMEQLA